MSTNSLAIRVSHINKKYRLGGSQKHYHTFLDAIVNSLKAQFHRGSFIKIPNPSVNEFWALKEISFDVVQGVKSWGLLGGMSRGRVFPVEN